MLSRSCARALCLRTHVTRTRIVHVREQQRDDDVRGAQPTIKPRTTGERYQAKSRNKNEIPRAVAQWLYKKRHECDNNNNSGDPQQNLCPILHRSNIVISRIFSAYFLTFPLILAANAEKESTLGGSSFGQNRRLFQGRKGIFRAGATSAQVARSSPGCVAVESLGSESLPWRTRCPPAPQSR
jgi:hypothetical protein